MKRIIFFIFIVNVGILAACSDAKTQSLEGFYEDANIEMVDRVIIQDGTTGASKSITDQERINEFLSLTKDIEFSPQDNQEESVGWLYAITLVDNEKEFKFTLSKIGDNYYKSNPDIYPIVDAYYKQLD